MTAKLVVLEQCKETEHYTSVVGI